MNTTLKFDRVILTKELNEKFKQVGDVFEVANVLEKSFLLRDAKTKVDVGVISFDDFEEHFVHEENFKGWTDWMPFVGFNGQTDALYRTNRKKTQVKFLTDKVRAEACCSKVNEFKLPFGIQAAYLRCLNKAREKQKTELEKQLSEVSKQKAELEEKLKMVNHDIAENETILKKMINSLEA